MAGRESRYARSRSWCDLRPNAECERRSRADRFLYRRRTSIVLFANLVETIFQHGGLREDCAQVRRSQSIVHASLLLYCPYNVQPGPSESDRNIKNDLVRPALRCDVTSVTTAG